MSPGPQGEQGKHKEGFRSPRYQGSRGSAFPDSSVCRHPPERVLGHRGGYLANAQELTKVELV